MADEKKNQLHALLAVEGELKGTAASIVAEATQTFKQKAVHFQGAHEQYAPFNEGDKATESFEKHQEMVTTVRQKLEYVFGHMIQLVDVSASKDRTNQEARADIIVDGITLARDVPATTLLGLESELKSWQAMLQEVPTLAPGIAWERDETRSTKDDTVWKAKHPSERFKTAKTFKSKILVEAIIKDGVGLPAQIEKWSEDENIGKFVTQVWSGMLTPADKSALLGRLSKLSRAVKTARQTANATEVVQVKLGKAMADYLLKF